MPELIELSVDEVAKLAEVVRSRISHPSHTPVQAVRAGLQAVNAMRLADVHAEVVALPVAPLLPRPADPPRARKVDRLGLQERNSEWMDVDGDRWRWSWSLCQWQYKPLNRRPWEGSQEWLDVPTGADSTPSTRYAPFTEVPRS
ncbi:hypothetical protein SEA_MARSHAWN_70 [Mycobacterium phage Marshawn]|uniref:DUF7183 domain-containing protein n=1 Tax=Mycobacterium phage Marshawn TaxID=2652423 RepID=A0A5P8D770_9CAUD|nr:hypothetical protein I5H02_gp29 [Mycobacterium phage Marshawn]QFP94856.1 hypothetical protein SEA_MARSHAWN_70 [Mycobacterium phage Marshawn]